MVKTVERELGSVEILVNNAGISRRQALEEIGEKDWDELIAANLKSAFLVTQAVLPAMRARRWGRIIFISSVAAQNGGILGGPHYAASLVKEGITANAISPAQIETDMITRHPGAKPNLIPIGRFGTPVEMAEVVVMLAGNGYITGQTINVNGGWYMN